MARKTTAYARRLRHQQHVPPVHYPAVRELLASAIEPMPWAQRDAQLSAMWAGFLALQRAEQPSPNDWRVCSDAVNLLETLVAMGECADHSGLLPDAIAALGAAGHRAMQGKVLRLDGAGIQAIQAVLEDYAQALAALPERTVLRAHRLTEKRIRAILAKPSSGQMEVIAL